MRRILHVSDLHFGRDRAELLRPLIDTINRLSPDLVAISGDFTQRARLGQYRAARTFLSHLEPPTISVPGNHDTPLDNLFERLVRPWHRYRRYIDRNLEPSFEDEEISLAGVNTVNQYSWQRGLFRSRAIRRVCAAFGRKHERRRMHIVMVHHPLEHTPGVDKRLMRGARDALDELHECGADIVLSGHLHTWRAEPFADRSGLLLVQAGTSLSTRVRGEPNDFNLLSIEGRRVTVERYCAASDATHFDLGHAATFEKVGDGWAQST
ncbi:metallophosphoesterase family protein [Roseitranquillus sediminis]|uniref:metallophosphoesterase family protein n=1 Tax=Roseitranquillus sediminis TaxID=2809051 RepID=UPI001D0C332C|nr:metallophosphoesterase family protein [Roseitranquillus sediminis]MBM9596247.1 metallophosphoesterase [Roseitranquillus sediminis]